MFKDIINFVKDDKLKIIATKEEVNIVNFKEILEFDDKEIIIETKDNLIIVKGEHLIINKFMDKEILIIGEIKTIEME